jgi:hypothetical protein
MIKDYAPSARRRQMLGKEELRRDIPLFEELTLRFLAGLGMIALATMTILLVDWLGSMPK